MIRTHILHWSQSCRNRIFGTTVRFQHGQIPAVLCPGRVTTRQDKSGSGYSPVLEPNQTEPQVKTRTAGRLPGPVANTTGLSYYCDQFHCRTTDECLGHDCKVEYPNAIQGIMHGSHNIWDQYTESNIDNTFQGQVSADQVLYFCWTPLNLIVQFPMFLPGRKSVSNMFIRFKKTLQWILHPTVRDQAADSDTPQRCALLS
jgi:hypothetical protein